MSDKPIIFSGEMVRALLAGRKSMTRRILKSQPPEWVTRMCHEGRNGWIGSGDGHGVLMHVPYAPGDRLWVREAHAMLTATAYRASIGVGTIAQREHPTDGYTAAVFRAGFDRSGRPRWRPSIHMPRWASRLTLLVTDVRVQRLQEISRGDAMEEGCPFANMADGPNPRDWYRDIWNSIHGPDAWDANQWVAAISFTVHRCNIDTMEEGTW